MVRVEKLGRVFENGPLRSLNLRSGRQPSAANSCATASSSAIALVLPPAAEDAAAAEPSRAAPRRSSRARRAPATMATPCLKSIRAAFLGQSSRQEHPLFLKLCMGAANIRRTAREIAPEIAANIRCTAREIAPEIAYNMKGYGRKCPGGWVVGV